MQFLEINPSYLSLSRLRTVGYTIDQMRYVVSSLF